MPVYLDLGAQRIQSWLAATPKLDHLRGASRALASTTSADEIQQWLGAHPELSGCEIASEAGEKDGVVVLTCPDTARAETAATSLIAHLQTQLPRVEWAGWWTEAPSYLDAYVRHLEAREDVLHISAYPALHELPVLEQCDGCRQEPRIVRGSTSAPGPDCSARAGAREHPKELLYGLPGRWPKDFEDLALNGGLEKPKKNGSVSRTAPSLALGRKESRSHLALIKADGNKVGQLFKILANNAADLPTLCQSAVRDLNAATTSAVFDAAYKVSAPESSVKSALPHYVGGDDVLVSVPAALAWGFAATLGVRFDMLPTMWLKKLDADLPRGRNDALRERLETLINEVSLGIGMVFARADYPLAATLQVADEALEAAKRRGKGAESGIAWVDLSAEGLAGARRGAEWLQYIPAHRAYGEIEGTRPHDLATAVFTVEPAGRSRLARVIVQAADDAQAGLAAELWCRNTGRAQVLVNAAQKDVSALPPLLSRARWWPLAAVEEATR